MARHCLTCESRPARRIEAKFKRDSKMVAYANGADEPVFCSQRCAAAWALLHVALGDDNAWCDTHGWMTPTAQGECWECDIAECN